MWWRTGCSGSGWDGLLMDAHGGIKSKREFARLMADSIRSIRSIPEQDHSVMHERLSELRRELLSHDEAMHQPRAPWNVTLYEVQGGIMGAPQEALASEGMPPDRARGLDREAVDRLMRDAREWVDLGGHRLNTDYPEWARSNISPDGGGPGPRFAEACPVALRPLVGARGLDVFRGYRAARRRVESTLRTSSRMFGLDAAGFWHGPMGGCPASLFLQVPGRAVCRVAHRESGGRLPVMSWRWGMMPWVTSPMGIVSTPGVWPKNILHGTCFPNSRYCRSLGTSDH